MKQQEFYSVIEKWSGVIMAILVVIVATSIFICLIDFALDLIKEIWKKI